MLSIKEHNDNIIVIKFLIKEDTNLIFTGSFDAIIKVFALDLINLNEKLNNENIIFNYSILTIFNKDNQISDILLFDKNNEENNNKVGMIFS